MPGEGGKMTFLEHLEELRRRLIYCAAAVCGGVVVCWIFREEIRAFLEAPLYEAWATVEGLPPPQPLSFTSLVEPFTVYLKLSAIGGVFLAVPVILYNLWKFVSPGLYARERRIALPFVFVSSLLFLGGSTLAYAYVFPIGIRFFLDFAAGGAPSEYAAAAVAADPEAASPEGEAPGPGPDGGPEGGEDAGVPDPDAEGVRPAAPRTAPGRRPAPPEARARTLYDLAGERLLGEGCGELAAGAGAPGEIALRFSWHEETCGAPPELGAARRDGEAVDLAWEPVGDGPAGFAVLEARDAPVAGGRHAYALRALGRGADGRKLSPILMLTDYLSFALKLLFAFGVVFELPVLIVFLSLAGIVDYRQLLRFSRWFLVIALVVGAILTPPDVVSQVMLAGPLLALYFVSVLIAYLIGRKRGPRG